MFKKILLSCLLICMFTTKVYAYDVAHEEYEMKQRNEAQSEREEQRLVEDIKEVALVVHAEAGNQDLLGKILVASVIENRVNDSRFPNNVHDVIWQSGQFNVVRNGAYNKAKRNIDMESYAAAWMVFTEDKVYDDKVLFFSRGKGPGYGHYKHGDHWFSYK